MAAKKSRARNSRRDRAGTPGSAGRQAGSKATVKADKAAKQIRNRGMSTNLRVMLGLLTGAVAAALLVIIVNLGSGSAQPATADALVRPDSHKLSTAADGKATIVEFLDFECESCLAAYPDVEKLRAEYGDRITYVVRYFPIASHPNAFNAAHAAEAAARQGKFEQMYKKLFDNATKWGHNERSQVATFEAYAQDLGLDIQKYRTDVTSTDVATRVKADADDGTSLGVKGTPTFFINGTKFDGSPTYDGLKAAVDKVLAP